MKRLEKVSGLGWTFILILGPHIILCQNATVEGPILPGTIDNGEETTIDDLITPSDECKLIVAQFASAISNFTLCSVTNARPIHLCQWCIGHYLVVVQTHNAFLMTIDEKGNPCQEYFTNLDRIEIVFEAYHYVDKLWSKGKCDYCFEKSENETFMPPRETEDVANFDADYELTKSCFNKYLEHNQTEWVCANCSAHYEKLNSFYIDIGERYGENVCLDIVDTMNTTREIWSQIFKCVPDRKSELTLLIAMGLVMTIPIIFYLMTFILSTKTEAAVYQHRRLAELFLNTSDSGGTTGTDFSGYVTSRPTVINDNNSSGEPRSTESESTDETVRRRINADGS